MSSYGERFAEAVRDYLVQNRLVNASGEPSLGKLSGKILGELADRFEQAEVRRGKAEKAKRLSKADRNKLFDALAAGVGRNLEAMTETEQTRCAVALAKIIKATPDVTPEDVTAACAKYRRDFSGATISETAIMSNWSKLFDSHGRGKKPAIEPIPEPDDWKGLMRDDPDDKHMVGRAWATIERYYQNRIAKKCAAIKRNP